MSDSFSRLYNDLSGYHENPPRGVLNTSLMEPFCSWRQSAKNLIVALEVITVFSFFESSAVSALFN